MKRTLSYTAGIIVLAFGSIASTVFAQTTANGPYYATPSWDQTLPSSTRFIVLSNMGSNAVLDRETGLVWERSPSTGPVPLFNALVACNTKTLGNRKGWRLPTVSELASLVDGDPANTGSPRLPPGHPFQNVQPARYWSATSIALNTQFVWFVSFFDGDTGGNDKNLSVSPFWCVRAGQGGVDPQ